MQSTARLFNPHRVTTLQHDMARYIYRIYSTLAPIGLFDLWCDEIAGPTLHMTHSDIQSYLEYANRVFSN